MTPFYLWGSKVDHLFFMRLFLLLNKGTERFKLEELDGLTNGLTGRVDDNFKMV